MSSEISGYEAPELYSLGSLTELTQGASGVSVDDTFTGVLSPP